MLDCRFPMDASQCMHVDVHAMIIFNDNFDIP